MGTTNGAEMPTNSTGTGTHTATREAETIRVDDVLGPDAAHPLTPRRHRRADRWRDASDRVQSPRILTGWRRRSWGRWQEGCWGARQSRGRPYQQSEGHWWEASWRAKATNGTKSTTKRRFEATSVGMGAVSEESGTEQTSAHYGALFGGLLWTWRAGVPGGGAGTATISSLWFYDYDGYDSGRIG